MSLAIDPSVGLDVATDAVERAMRAGADGAKVLHGSAEVFEVNFDTSEVTLVRSTVSDTLSITVFSGGRKGTTDLTGRAHDAVDRAVADALQAAQAGEPDVANVLPEEPAEPAVSRGDDTPDKDAMVDAVLRHIARVKAEFPTIRSDASRYTFECSWVAYANSFGRKQHARRGNYQFSTVVTGKDDARATSFAYATVASAQPFDDPTSLPAIRGLLRDTAASFDPKPVPATFVGDLIFTPRSMGTLVGSVAGALGGLALLRKGTPFLDSLGESIASSAFSLLHRPSLLPSANPFDGEGFVNHDLDVIRDGVLENFLIDWFSSRKLDRPMTTGSGNFVVPAGDTPLAEIIANTERGILLGRYSGGQPNQNLEFSGVAKNSFYVEGGKIVGPTTETMVAGSFRSVLDGMRAISKESMDFGYASFPWLATTGVTISTK